MNYFYYLCFSLADEFRKCARQSLLSLQPTARHRCARSVRNDAGYHGPGVTGVFFFIDQRSLKIQSIGFLVFDQRPFAIALLLPTQPIARDIAHFQQVSVKMLLPLLCCNRRFVHSILRCATMMLANGDHCNTQSYYSTSGNAQLIVVVSAKIRSVIQQVRHKKTFWIG